MNPATHCASASISELKKAFYNRTPIEGIQFIGTHYGPHNDELFGGYLLRETPQGMRQFPGIEKATFGSISATELREKNFLGEEDFFRAMKGGLLLIGIGGGPLDEHDNRREKISCTERIVRLLNLTKEKADRKIYGRLIRYVNFEDGNGDNAIECLDRIRKKEKTKELSAKETDELLQLQIGAFAQNLKKGFEAAGDDEKKQQEIFQMAFQFYRNEINQSRLFCEAERLYESAVRQTIDLVTPGTDEKLVLLEMESDALLMNKVVANKWRNDREKKLGVLFLRKTNGQFVLIPNRHYLTTSHMREVVKILRQTTAQRADTGVIKFTQLEKDQWIEEIPELYFDENTGIISNGSKTDPFVPGLIGDTLSIKDVIRSVQIGLDTAFFAKEFASGCKAGVCVKGRCWMYNLGQQRCYDVRNQAKEKERQPA